MASESKRKCPDCENIDTLSRGNGKCNECKGTGHDRHAEALVQFATLGTEGNSYPCKTCSGTGQCQTCGGTGYEYYYEARKSDSRVSDDNSSDEGGVSGFFGKVIGILIVAAIVIWLVFAVVIPLAVINIAVIALIIGMAKKEWSKILFPFSILGSIYLIVDYNKGFFTKALVSNVSFLDGLVPILFYINILAGLVSAYLLIRDQIDKKKLQSREKGSSRNEI